MYGLEHLLSGILSLTKALMLAFTDNSFDRKQYPFFVALTIELRMHTQWYKISYTTKSC